MDLGQVERKRAALVQVLLLMIMLFLVAITYTSVSRSFGPLVPTLTLLCLGACLFVTTTERKLRRLHDLLIEELTARDRKIRERDCKIDEKDRRIDNLDREIATLQQQAHANQLEAIASVIAGQAHEIATPISAAKSAGETAAAAARRLSALLSERQDLAAEGREALEELTEGCDLLARNIERALTLIKAFRNQSARQLSDELMIVDLKEVVSDCIYAMRPETKKKGVTIDLRAREKSSYLWNGYPGAMTQVIVNLIQNVLRHAFPDQRGAVEIRLRAEGETYVVEFEDHGAGIAPEVLPRIFDPMVTTARDRGGTGLGLSISREIVVGQLKGTIDCSSQLGKGTTMTIVVPKDVLGDEPEDD